MTDLAMVERNYRFLGWSGIDIRLGNAIVASPDVTVLALDWQPGDIRNCSYAPARRWIGISAEDRTYGEQVLAIHDLTTGANRVLLRANCILQHALNASGSRICYTAPSANKGACDLFVYVPDADNSTRVSEGSVAYGCIPAWFPDDAHIAFSSSQGFVEVIDIMHGRRERLAEGHAPAVHPDGKRVAFRNNGSIAVMDIADRTTEALETRGGWLEHSLSGSISWSPDGRCLSFGFTSGMVGKQIAFFMLDVAGHRQTRINAPFLRDLTLIPG